MASPLPFAVQPTSGVPIYRQVVEQVTALAAGGGLAEGELLPSVRAVAEALGVNPMTVSKAYSQLEADGVVERVRGKGMRVLPAADSETARRAALAPHAADLAVRGRQLGLSDQAVLDVVREALAESAEQARRAAQKNGST